MKNILLLLLLLFTKPVTYASTEPVNTISVILHGIRNDGSPIGKELNELVKDSYGKTLYFPAGTYTLTEPIVLPFNYEKSVNLILDPSATLRTDSKLDALLKIGFSEMEHPDHSLRKFSLVEGGKFDCTNADNGIWVNGLKQLVSLRKMSVFNGRKCHIRISVTEDFKGTGSSDTKLDDVTIQGPSSEEEITGLYIDHSCCDCKIADCFIYGCKYGMLTRSAGHIVNNLHILSMHTGLGKRSQPPFFHDTEGIRIESGGFFIFNEVYFDTTDRDFVIAKGCNPQLIIDKCITHTYMKNLGKSFIYRDHEDKQQLMLKVSNCIFNLDGKPKGFRIFDIAPEIIWEDVNDRITFSNCLVNWPHHIHPTDPAHLLRFEHRTAQAVTQQAQVAKTDEWYVMAALAPSESRAELQFIFGESKMWLSGKFDGERLTAEQPTTDSDAKEMELGWTVKDGVCLLCFRTKKEVRLRPEIIDLLGNAALMGTPHTTSLWTLKDYGAETHSPTLLHMKKKKR